MGKYGGKVIHSRHDEHGAIEVIDTHGIRSLHFGSPARQSAMALASPDRLELSYLRAMLVGLVFVPDPRRILVLGLGGGSLARYLLRHCPAAQIEVVESRAAVVGVARDYFGLPEQPRLSIQVADGGEFLIGRANQHDSGYDFILIDVFDDEGLSPVVTRHDFFVAVASVLATGGVLCVNLWSGHAATVRTVMRQLKLYCPDGAFSLPVMGRGNVIGVGLQRGAGRPRAKECLPRARALEQRMDVEFIRLLQRLAPPLPR